MLITIFFLLILIVNPFVAAVSSGMYCYTRPRLYFDYKLLLCIIPPLFLALFNSTKIPNNDLVWYLDFYSDAGKYKLKDYFFWIGNYQHVDGIKEPVYTIFTYFSYYLLDGNRQLFVLFHSLICYIIINLSIIKLGNVLKCKPHIIVAVVIYADFCPYIFMMSAHLLRQILANALLIYIVVDEIKDGKYNIKHFLLSILMILIHSSSALFVPIIMIKYFERPISRENFLIYGLIFMSILFIQLFATAILPYVESLGPIGYFVARASHGTTYEMEGLDLFKISVSVFITLVCVVSVYGSWLKNNGKIVQFTNVMIILCIFFLGNIYQPEMAIRYNFYIWLFSPYVLVLFLKAFKVSMTITTLFGLAFIIFFISKMEFGETWDYRIKEMYLYTPVFYYF